MTDLLANMTDLPADQLTNQVTNKHKSLLMNPNLDFKSALYGDWKVDMGLSGKVNSNSHGAWLVHQIISMLKWIWTSGLSIKNYLFDCDSHAKPYTLESHSFQHK